ncbi:hypothetical protein PFISCL1PPCAC_3143, partial [Pristionchus fissidentatus]
SRSHCGICRSRPPRTGCSRCSGSCGTCPRSKSRRPHRSHPGWCTCAAASPRDFLECSTVGQLPLAAVTSFFPAFRGRE